MQKKNKKLILSPSDVVRFVQSPFASWMERLCIEQPEFKELKDKPDALLNYLAGRGLEHEDYYLANTIRKPSLFRLGTSIRVYFEI